MEIENLKKEIKKEFNQIDFFGGSEKILIIYLMDVIEYLYRKSKSVNLTHNRITKDNKIYRTVPEWCAYYQNIEIYDNNFLYIHSDNFKSIFGEYGIYDKIFMKYNYSLTDIFGSNYYGELVPRTMRLSHILTQIIEKK